MKSALMLSALAVILISSGCTASATSPSGHGLTFSSEANNPSDESMGITLASGPQQQGSITLAASGFNLANALSALTHGVSGVGGRVTWDNSLFMFEPVGSGAFLQQGGAAVACWHHPRYTTSDPADAFTFLVTRSGNVTGSGEVFLFKLTPRSGAPASTSWVRFTEYTENVGAGPGGLGFQALVVLSPFSPGGGGPLQHFYGGTVTIQ